MKKEQKLSLGTRKFIPFDERTDLGFLINIAGKRCCFKVMVHPCSDDPNGVIFWFDLEEFKDESSN